MLLFSNVSPNICPNIRPNICTNIQLITGIHTNMRTNLITNISTETLLGPDSDVLVGCITIWPEPGPIIFWVKDPPSTNLSQSLTQSHCQKKTNSLPRPIHAPPSSITNLLPQ